MILPGETLGILGGGQLGRMFVIAARTMGYEVIVLDPDPESPAGGLASEHICADYEDIKALEKLAGRCAAVTIEFENVPANSLESIAKRIAVRPSADAIRIARDRILEKETLREIGLDTVPYHVIEKQDDIPAALENVTLPAILKTATLGYDGKGQALITDASELENAFIELGAKPCVLEQRIDLAHEISVVLARGISGKTRTFSPAENRHKNGILDLSIIPARIGEELIQEAERMARNIANELDYVGVLTVEFFIDQSDTLLVNEIAPRPHNSGHYTIDACLTDQYQQQVLTLCGFSPADSRLLSSAVMVNILGDAWNRGTPAWEIVLNDSSTHLHLYGKKDPRPGRKMGHFTCIGDDIDILLEKAETLASGLSVNSV